MQMANKWCKDYDEKEEDDDNFGGGVWARV